MLDAIAIVATLALFSLSFLYVTGCDRLKGNRA